MVRALNMEKTQHSQLERCIQDPVLGAGRLAIGAGATLYRPDAPALHLYLLGQGQVRTYRLSEGQEARLLEILGAGDWCGEAALAQQATYGEQAVAAVASVVWQIPANRLIERLARQPELAASRPPGRTTAPAHRPGSPGTPAREAQMTDGCCHTRPAAGP